MGTRADKAKELFMSGCNCSQAVFLAFADKYGVDEDTALKIASSFGGGMGRSREVCGALSGMLMVCGMETGSADVKDTAQKAENYRVARELMDAFREDNGSIYCRELLGLAQNAKESHIPAARTKEYYKKRPCAEIVRSAALILEEKFN
ncbi:MAG: C_GCAxxG_C_C family protein [Eubacterium sp.]|nr:C_GCAxxG_C_C family protein [Eubacterium sp.]MBR1530487.1 C_GCAxxG_C_C family protein [Eubacterium sp.]